MSKGFITTMSQGEITECAKISVENIGGIESTDVSITPGVTVLEGENATNRTSLMQAIMAGLGSDDVTIKGDADQASVELTIGGETYTRSLSRDGSTIHTEGEPYLDGPTFANLFAFLLGSNEARKAIRNNEALREIIMRGIDTDQIQREIEELLDQRRDVDAELEEIDSLKDRLPSLEERRTQLREEIEDTKDELAETEEELAARDADVKESRKEKEELEDRLSALRDRRSDLEDVRYDLETQRESLEATRADKREVETELEGLPEAPVGDISELEVRLDDLRERKRSLKSEVTEVQNVIGFNQEMLDEDDGSMITPDDTGEGDVTEELLPDDTVACWTCGSEIPREQIEFTIEQLQDRSERKLGEVSTIEDGIAEVNDEIRSLREKQRRREELKRGLEAAKRDIEESEAAIERLTTHRDELESEIEEMEAEIEDLEDDDEAYDEILGLHKEANQIEYEIGRLESDLEDVDAEITGIEDRIDAIDALETQRESIDEEIDDLRTRIDRIEAEAVEEFNNHIDAVLNILEYSNLERIWLERIEREVQEGRRKVEESVFELHIVRQTDGGATYEDTIDHLSESEREVTGLIFAFAGYLAHEVHKQCPFMLLDSVEAIDADRIAELIEYIEKYSEYFVVALLAEDAAALSDDYEYVQDI
jgi:septal ring factor EnvC (AmiA/AmiB activator)